MHRISIADKLASFADHWSPRIIAELNGQHVKLAKFKGEFVWHHHEAETSCSSSSAAGFAWSFAIEPWILRKVI